MPELEKTLKSIDWRLLSEQKIHLVTLASDKKTNARDIQIFDGLIGAIDAIQDAVVADGLVGEHEVFGVGEAETPAQNL